MMMVFSTIWVFGLLHSTFQAPGLPRVMAAASYTEPDLPPPSSPSLSKMEEEPAFLRLVCGGEESWETQDPHMTPPPTSLSSSSSTLDLHDTPLPHDSPSLPPFSTTVLVLHRHTATSSSFTDNHSLVSEESVLFRTPASPPHLHSPPPAPVHSYLAPAPLHISPPSQHLSISPHLSPLPSHLPHSRSPFAPSQSNEAEGRPSRRKRGAKGTKREKIKGDTKRTDTREKGDDGKRVTMERIKTNEKKREGGIATVEKHTYFRENKDATGREMMERKGYKREKSTKRKNGREQLVTGNKSGRKARGGKTITQREKTSRRKVQLNVKKEKENIKTEKSAKVERTKKNDTKGEKNKIKDARDGYIERKKDGNQENSKTRDSTKRTHKIKYYEENKKKSWREKKENGKEMKLSKGREKEENVNEKTKDRKIYKGKINEKNWDETEGETKENKRKKERTGHRRQKLNNKSKNRPEKEGEPTEESMKAKNEKGHQGGKYETGKYDTNTTEGRVEDKMLKDNDNDYKQGIKEPKGNNDEKREREKGVKEQVNKEEKEIKQRKRKNKRKYENFKETKTSKKDRGGITQEKTSEEKKERKKGREDSAKQEKNKKSSEPTDPRQKENNNKNQESHQEKEKKKMHRPPSTKERKDETEEEKMKGEEKTHDRQDKSETRQRQGGTRTVKTRTGRISQIFTLTHSTSHASRNPTRDIYAHTQLTKVSPAQLSRPSYRLLSHSSPKASYQPTHFPFPPPHLNFQSSHPPHFPVQPSNASVRPSHSHFEPLQPSLYSPSLSSSSLTEFQKNIQHNPNAAWRVDYLDPSFSYSVDGASLQLQARAGHADRLFSHARFSLHSPSSNSFTSTSSSSYIFPITVHQSGLQSTYGTSTPSPSLDSTSSSAYHAPALAVLQCSPQNSSPRVVLLAKECGRRWRDEVFPSDAVVLCPDPRPQPPPTGLPLPSQHPTKNPQQDPQHNYFLPVSSTTQPQPTTLSHPQEHDFLNVPSTAPEPQGSDLAPITTTAQHHSILSTTNTTNKSIKTTEAATTGHEDEKAEETADDNYSDAEEKEGEKEKEEKEMKEKEEEKEAIGGEKEDYYMEEGVEKGNIYVEEESFYEDEEIEEGAGVSGFLGGGAWPESKGLAQLSGPVDMGGFLAGQHGIAPLRGGLRRASRDLGLSHYPHTESAPQLRYTPIEQTVSPGAPVSLKCSAVGSPLPVITWTRDQQPLPPSHRTSVGSFRTALGQVVSHVNLSDVTVREGGTYTCTAHNAHGSQSHSARLNVYGPPFVRAMPNVTAVAGEDVWLWCPAGGYPAPAVSWRRDGRALPASLRQEVQSNGTLVVRTASHEDAGRYSCVVTGRQGQTAASHTFLHVLKPPEIDTFTFRRGLEEGRRTQLSCMVTGGDLPITINWLKDGRHLQHDPDLESKQVSDFSMVLVFKRLQEHHSGAYTCEAANAAAAVNHTATLKVMVSPRWLVEPGGGTALVGSTVVMDCSARGHPQPVITWMKAPGKDKRDFQPLVVDGLRSSQASNGSLILQDTKTSDAGWYMCRAANSVGKPISKAVQLTVHAPARVVTEGGRVTGHAGQVVTVACEATGDAPLILTWIRHHAPISPGHRVTIRQSEGAGMVRAVLEMQSVSAADAGPYTCRASNPHGDHSQVFDVAIIEPPTPPSNVGVSEVTSRSAVVTWSLPQPAAVTIQYKAAESETWSTHGRNVSVGQWAASHVLTGLSPHLTYAVRLMAHNDLGVSVPSPTQLFTTTEEAPSGAPRDVRVAPGGVRSLLVTWRAPDPRLTHGALRGYTLALRRQNLQGHFTFITRPVNDLAGVEQYEVRGLVPASLYEVAVRAFTRAGPGPLSSPRIVDSTSQDAPSCAPAGVSCRGSGRGGVRVWWSPPPTSCVHAQVSGYTIVATPTRHIQSSSSDSSSWEVNTTNLEKNLDALPPATNISVRVKAYNEVGFSAPSRPVFCVTEDDVPGPPEEVRAVVTGPTTLLVTWSPPRPHTGTILHYTLYSSRDDQVAMRDVVGAGGSEATWRELSGLTPASRMQVWVTATTVAGEGNPSPRVTAVPNPKPGYTPVAVGGGRVWQVGVGAGVTLGCRGMGSPSPATSWTRGSVTVTSGQLTQLLPGGDLHLTAVRESDNYTCWAQSSAGVDSLTHQVITLTPPAAPMLSLSHATHHALNLTITPASDGGTPILGYTVHHRGRAGEWVEVEVAPGVSGTVVRGLACGAPHHVYLTAWNSQGASAPSPVLVASTLGSPPGRPEPERLVEVNSTCVTLRLYAWPELGCPVTHWKVELGSEEEGVAWTPLHSRVTLDTTDLGVCDLASASWHLLRVTASSTAGDTTVVYRVATTDGAGGSIAAESVQEVQVGAGGGPGGWLDAHIVAGVVSALLLATAFIICVCVAIRRRRYGGYRQGDSVDTKGGGGEDDNARNSELTRAHLYSPTPTKKPRGSLASLKTQDDTSDPYEICPYATFSVGSSDGTLEYGLSLHAMTPRDCLDHPTSATTHPHLSDRHAPAPPQSPAAYGHAGRQRSQSHYKETEIAYITRGGRGEYGSRPKSIPGAQLPPTSTTTAATATVSASAATPEQRQWAEEARKDTRGRQHRPRSRTRVDTPGGGRDSSTESNDASSPVQQGRHHHHYQHHHHPQAGGGAGARVGPHPLPPVRHARARTESSSSDSSTLTPPRPLHPPSAFSDSRELSEAECDRELRRGAEGEAGRTRGGQQEIKAELTVLLQRYQQQQQQHRDEDAVQQQQQQQQQQQDGKRRAPEKNPYTINV